MAQCQSSGLLDDAQAEDASGADGPAASPGGTLQQPGADDSRRGQEAAAAGQDDQDVLGYLEEAPEW